ncbi:alpha/beta hydrolase [Phytohabitans sp. ZYX-F-186]|uniref:Alpha/beta hydrolase n=1 Tax=Phytohabitans maris TaxID=3071409 RepID=A0ABU0ZNF7_9ACTN|nr:alpha/beta hydrolase [Phytohabitans sp. ZYX-F-186]MDQ7908569.1 alpha/beta hydrolase [Phytohabitans sp. ZYX-F-186]
MKAPPVVLVHGFASSPAHNWGATGWLDLLAEDGRTAVPLTLPGHAPGAPTDPAAYADVPGQVAAHIAGLVDAIGFSAGAEVLLAVAAASPHRFRRLALLGAGPSMVEAAGDGSAVAAALLAPDEPDDAVARPLRRMAAALGHDPAALAAFIRRPRRPLGFAALARIACPVLVVIGDRDFVGPADPLVAALPDARLVVLPGLDHYGTTADPRAVEAVLRFLGGGDA